MARILIVDDEIGIRELLQEVLQDHLHEVVTAGTVEEANTLLTSFSPNIVLLDVWMKESNGLDLLQQWQANGLVTMPVIMMSGHANVEIWSAASKFGAYCLIEKPISTKILLNTLKPALIVAFKEQPLGLKKLMVPSPYAVPPPVFMAGPKPAFMIDPPRPPEPPPHPIFDQSYKQAREMFDRAYFSHQITVHRGSMSLMSEFSGVERTHLYRVLKSLGLNDLKTLHRAGKPVTETDVPDVPVGSQEQHAK